MQYFALLLFAVLCAVGLVRQTWALVLLFVMFALEVSMQASVDIFRTQGALANFIVAGVVAVSTIVGLLRQRRPFLGHLGLPILLVLTVFGWSILSLLWTPAVAGGPNEGSNIIVEGLPYFLVFVLAAPMLVGSIRDWREVTTLMLFIGSLVALSIVLSPEFSIRQGRIGVGLEGVHRTSPLALGQMGGMLAIFGALSAGGRVTWIQSSIRVFAFICGALLALLSGSRGQVIFALFAIVAFLPMSRRLKNFTSYFSLVAIAAVVVVGGMLVFDYASGQADADRWRGGAIADATAVRQWSVGQLLGAFLESPGAWIIGLGYNAFSTLGGVGDLGYVHNIYAEVLAELGLPMFALLVLFFVLTGRAALSLFRHYRDHPAERSALSILLAMIVYQALISAKEGTIWSAWSLFTVMLMTNRLDRRVRELGDDALVDEPYGAEEPVDEAPADSEHPPLEAGQPA